jgi:hypothetical protein
MIEWLFAGLKVGGFIAGVFLPIMALTKIMQWIGPPK